MELISPVCGVAVIVELPLESKKNTEVPANPVLTSPAVDHVSNDALPMVLATPPGKIDPTVKAGAASNAENTAPLTNASVPTITRGVITLPVELINPPVNKLPPVILADEVIVPVELINPPVNKLPPVMLPVTLKLVPVAAPMFGVVKFALALTTMFPVLNAVVTLSTNALITVPLRLIPADVFAE